MASLLIHGGDVYSSSGNQRVDVVVEHGKIVRLGHGLVSSEEYRNIKKVDATGKWVFPGIIDSQVHFREPGLVHKEDLESGSRSAALGGVTTFLEMPNTSPSTTSAERIAEKVAIGKQRCYTNFGFFMGATGDNIEELKKIPKLEGCCGIKIFLGSSTGSLLLYDKDKLTEIFEQTESPIAIHSENEQMLNERKYIRDAANTAHAHPVWRNEQVALSSTEMVVSLAEKAKRKIHVLHISTQKEIEFLSKHKKYVSVEVLPQHLTLFAPDCYDRLGTYAQMNPPIRDKKHQEALWQGIHNRTVDVIGSDHAPHTKEEKDQGYPKSPSGMPGVQTIFPIMLNHVSEGRLSTSRLIELMCEKPATMYGLNKGFIDVGKDADFTIVDPELSVELKNQDMATKSGWTPYDGVTVKGFPIATIVGGNIVMENGSIVSKPVGQPIMSS